MFRNYPLKRYNTRIQTMEFKIILNVLALSDSFEYLCYGSTAMIFFNSFSAGDRLYTSESDI